MSVLPTVTPRKPQILKKWCLVHHLSTVFQMLVTYTQDVGFKTSLKALFTVPFSGLGLVAMYLEEAKWLARLRLNRQAWGMSYAHKDCPSLPA